jgi:hypothetical protein
VVEVEYDNITFPAINARMFCKMGIHEKAVSPLVDLRERIPPGVVRTFGASIMLAYICQLTRLTVCAGESIALFEERIERLFLFAAWANLHASIVAFRCANTLAVWCG